MADSAPQRIVLTATQRRVLGVLVEKCFTTPDQYPLTLNALVSGCNQKSNRSPVVDHSEGEVANAIQELISKGLAKYADVQAGARSNRFAHSITDRYPWAPREQAVLAELMLRGPQTAGEIRTRGDRMVKMADLQYAQGILDELASADPPLVVQMDRVPGQSVVRYRHNLYTDDELEEEIVVAAAAPRATASPARTDELTQRIDGLEQRLAELESRVDRLMS